MKRILAILLIACVSIPLAALGCPLALAMEYEGMTLREFDALQETTVIASPDSPTGYCVTFRYRAEEGVQRVRFFGEMMYSDVRNTVTLNWPESKGDSLHATPEEWKPGYFPNANGGSWLIADMEYSQEYDVWSYTVPVPSGSFNYRFIVGGSPEAALDDMTGAVYAWDPANPPYVAEKPEKDRNAEEYMTGIEVPFDPSKQVTCRDIEMPRDGENGAVEFFTYTGAGREGLYAGVYLPYGYQETGEPYKLVILCHGSGGYEGAWFNEGAAVNILDNLFAMGYEKFVVVTPNLTQYEGFDDSQYTQALLYDMMDYVEERYNVSKDVNDRAIGGLSYGGDAVHHALFLTDEQTVKYAMFFSSPNNGTEEDFTRERMAIIQDVDVLFVAGRFENKSQFDLLFDDHGMYYDQLTTLGGHQWTVWKEGLVYAVEHFLWQ